MLIKLPGPFPISQRTLENLAILVWKNSANEAILFHEYFENVIWGYPMGKGGAIFRQDPVNTEIIWMDCYSPGCLPRPENAKGVMVMLQLMGFKFLACETEQEVIRKFVKKLGMQDIGEDIFSIKLDGLDKSINP